MVSTTLAINIWINFIPCPWAVDKVLGSIHMIIYLLSNVGMENIMQLSKLLTELLTPV